MNRAFVFYVPIGLVAATVFAAALVPARAITLATDDIDDLTLLDFGGTVWHGQADVVYRDIDIGRVAWSMDWLAPLTGRLGAHWRLDRAGLGLAGRVECGWNAFALTMAGSVEAAAVNPLLGNYGIQVGGTLAIDDLSLRNAGHSAGGPWMLAGRLRWTGGRTTYRLSGRTYAVTLPPMVASLATQPGAVVLDAHLEEERMLLLEARLRDGWAEVGMTKRFSQLAGKPWLGNAADHAVVLTVERQLPDAWWPAGVIIGDSPSALSQPR